MAQRISDLPIGAKIKFGKYQVERETANDIVWYIADKNHAGYPSDSVTLVTEDIIDYRAYDAKEIDNTNPNIQDYGNSLYSISNIRKWLNGSGYSWYTDMHDYDSEPIDSYTLNNTGYFSKRPFSYLWTENDKSYLLKTDIYVNETRINDHSSHTIPNISNINNDGLGDYFFILSLDELSLTNSSEVVHSGTPLELFNDITKQGANPSSYAIANSSKTDISNSTLTNRMYWTRSYKNSYTQFCVYNNIRTSIRTMNPYDGGIGIRPACNVADSMYVSDTLDSDGCYTIEYNPPPTIVFDKRTDSSENIGIKYYVNGIDNVYSCSYRLNGEAFSTTSNIQSGLSVNINIPITSLNNGENVFEIIATDIGDGTLFDIYTLNIYHNDAPFIDCNSINLGNISSTPTINYTIIDAQGDPVSLTFKIDGTQVGSILTNVALNTSTSYTVDNTIFTNLSLGNHTLTIIADDGRNNNSIGTKTIQFVKVDASENSVPIIKLFQRKLGSIGTSPTVYYMIEDENTTDTITINVYVDDNTSPSFTDSFTVTDSVKSFRVPPSTFNGLDDGEHTFLFNVSDGTITVSETIEFTKISYIAGREYSLKDLPIGSKINFGRYAVEDETPASLEWVIADKNHNDYPNNSVTLVTNNVIDFRPFDVAEPSSDITVNRTNGNSRYSVSNIRQWLNSSKKNWYEYPEDNIYDLPPNDNFCYDEDVSYQDKFGFLYDFNQYEKDLLLDTEIKTANIHTSGNTITDDSLDITTDKVFLLSATEVLNISVSGLSEGYPLALFEKNIDRIGVISNTARLNSKYNNKPINNVPIKWILRSKTNATATNISNNNILENGNRGLIIPSNSDIGIRPAINIDGDTKFVYTDSSAQSFTLVKENTLNITTPDLYLGNKFRDFAFTYTVTGTEDVVTSSIYIDNELKSSSTINPNIEITSSISVGTLDLGDHVITINVTSDNIKYSSIDIHFTRSIYPLDISLLSELSVGSVVRFGKHQIDSEKPWNIKWYVADKDNANYPSNSVTLLTEKVIDFRSYDAKESSNPDTNAQSYGNTDYNLSNIRQWLNSDVNSNWYQSKHTYDQIPDGLHVDTGKGYENRPGFLYNFNNDERSLILDTSLICENNAGTSSDVDPNKVFLLSNTEIFGTTNGTIAEGTKLSLFNNTNFINPSSINTELKNSSTQYNYNNNFKEYYTRTLNSGTAYINKVSNTGELTIAHPYDNTIGIRPALNLTNDTKVYETTFIEYRPGGIQSVGPGKGILCDSPLEITVTGGNSLGDKIGEFTIEYTVTDPSDTVTGITSVSIVDNRQPVDFISNGYNVLQNLSNITLGDTLSFTLTEDRLSSMLGARTVTIIVTDAEGRITTSEVTFNVLSAPFITPNHDNFFVWDSFNVECDLSWSGNAGSHYTVDIDGTNVIFDSSVPIIEGETIDVPSMNDPVVLSVNSTIMSGLALGTHTLNLNIPVTEELIKTHSITFTKIEEPVIVTPLYTLGNLWTSFDIDLSYYSANNYFDNAYLKIVDDAHNVLYDGYFGENRDKIVTVPNITFYRYSFGDHTIDINVYNIDPSTNLPGDTPINSTNIQLSFTKVNNMYDPKSVLDLPIGTKIKLGKYQSLNDEEPLDIIWVIADKNYTGYPTDSVALLTKYGIEFLPYDAKEPSNPDTNIQSYGNADYNLSNIRQWLNSDASDDNWYIAQHEYDQSPLSNTFVEDNFYSSYHGFLYNFSSDEKSILLNTEINLLDTKIFLPSLNELIGSDALLLFKDNANKNISIAKVNYANTYLNKWKYSNIMTRNIDSILQKVVVYDFYGTSTVRAYEVRSTQRPLTNISSNTYVINDTDDNTYSIIYDINNPSIDVQEGLALGNKSEPFSINYKVTDLDVDQLGDYVDINIEIDGTSIYTEDNIMLDEYLEFNINQSVFNGLTAGPHIISIIATDHVGGSSTTDVTFSKIVPPTINIDYTDIGNMWGNFNIPFNVTHGNSINSTCTVKLFYGDVETPFILPVYENDVNMTELSNTYDITNGVTNTIRFTSEIISELEISKAYRVNISTTDSNNLTSEADVVFTFVSPPSIILSDGNDMGRKYEPFGVTYSIDANIIEHDSDFTIYEYINGTQINFIRSNVTINTNRVFDINETIFGSLPYGNNTIQIQIVNDGGALSQFITFNKSFKPTITTTLDTYLGVKTEDFDITFTADDNDFEDNITYAIYLDNDTTELMTHDNTLVKNVEKTVTIPFDMIPLGFHYIRLEVTDGGYIAQRKFYLNKKFNRVLLETDVITTDLSAEAIMVNITHETLLNNNSMPDILGYTTLDINITNEDTNISLNIYKSDNSNMYIDWGDGTGGYYSFVNSGDPEHNYNQIGEYTINIISAIDTFYFDTYCLGSSDNNVSLINIIFGENYRDTIGNSVFRNCTSLTSITIPEGVTETGDYTFRYCTSLSSVTLPESISTIGSYAFNGCTSLTSITIPEGVTTIGNSAFNNCTSLTSIIIPESVTSINKYAFYTCRSLTSAYFNGNIPTTFGSSVFDYTHSSFTIFYDNTKTGWTTPTWNGYPCYPNP